MVKALMALKERRSIRKYENRPIPREVLEDIIDCGRLAASANNLQPWEFVVVTDREKLQKIGQLATYGRFIANAGACVAVFGKKDAKYLVEDCSAATQNIMVAARAHGVGSCWVAGHGKEYAKDIAKLLAVPGEYSLVSLIALGYPAEEPTRSKRSLEEVIHWEKF